MVSKMGLETLRVVGSIGELTVDIADIQRVLQQEQQQLGRDGDFIGKNTTTLYANDTHVVKLQMAQQFEDVNIAFSWLGHHVKKEREAKVYHPSRCWFIMLYQGRWITGNITLRLLPVHTVFESLDKVMPKHLALLSDITEMYLEYAARIDKRLDEGLSNFGLDGDQLYYMDDDIFEWDQFHSFSALIAGWLRRYSALWFSVSAVTTFAKALNKQLSHYFKEVAGLDAPQVMAEQLHGMFFPAYVIQDAADALIAVLRYGDSGCMGRKHERFDDLDAFAQCFHEDESIAILADVHANLPALEVVLAEVRHRGIERIFVLGDLVGYGPHPEACIDMLRSVGAISLRGNHDHAVGSGKVLKSMSSSSSSWTTDWSIQRLTSDYKNYLRHLPLRMISRPWMAVHGAPVDKTFFNAYVYNRTAEVNIAWLQEHGYRFGLHGHSHLQGVYAANGSDPVCLKGQYIDLNAYQTNLICPGSVGQPRGGEVGAAFAILQPLSCKLELLCLPYDVSEVIQDMVVEQFPEQLMRRLKTGV